mgnify:CR=1 FL=1
MFDTFVESTLLMFVAIDPISLVPIFAGLTAGLNKDQIKYQFNQMVKKNLIYTLENIDGYQKYEFKNIIPMMG